MESSIVVCVGEPTSKIFLECWLLECYPLINQYSCLGHVVNLAEVDMMTHITKLAVIEMTLVILEYNPFLPDNYVLNDSLNVIAAIQTLSIKVHCITIYLTLHSLTFHKFRHLSSILKHLKSYKSNVSFKTHSKYHFTGISGEIQHISCSV